MTSQEDLDDVAFRALLAPLALEVLPGRSPRPTPEPADPAELEDGTSPDGQSPPDAIPPGSDAPGPNATAHDARPDAPVSAVRSEARLPLAEVTDDPAASTSAAVADDRSPSQSASPAHLAMPQHGPTPLAAVPGHPIWSVPNLPLDGGLPASAAPPGEMLPEAGSVPEAALPFDPTSAASDVQPKDHSPPAIAPAHSVAPAAERLSEDWWAPPSAPLDLPAVPSPDGPKEHRKPPAAGQFALVGNRGFSRGQMAPDRRATGSVCPVAAALGQNAGAAHPIAGSSDFFDLGAGAVPGRRRVPARQVPRVRRVALG